MNPATTGDGVDPLCALMGTNARKRREALGISQSRLAAAISGRGSARWTAATVSAFETGRRNVGPTEISDVLDVLQMTWEQILTLKSDEEDGFSKHRVKVLTQRKWTGRRYDTSDISVREARERRLEENVWRALRGGHPTAEDRQQLEERAVWMFGRPLLDERDRRTTENHSGDGPPGHAAYGHATRSIIADLQTYLTEEGEL